MSLIVISEIDSVLSTYILSNSGRIIAQDFSTSPSDFLALPNVLASTTMTEIDSIQYAETLSPQDVEELRYHEGATKQITINAYERNDKAREECIQKKGYACVICGQSLMDLYGNENLLGKIHVHHIIPLSQIKSDYEVTVDDLIPVCPNCHFVLHSRGTHDLYTVEEVKNMFINARNRKPIS